MKKEISKEFIRDMTEFCGSHSILVKRTADPLDQSLIHAPISLRPSPFSRILYEEAHKSQHPINALISRLATDHSFLRKALERVQLDDEFVAGLLRVSAEARVEGKLHQPIFLGILRTDYMIDKVSR